MESLTQFTLTNSTELVVSIMAAYVLVSLVYVLLRETRLLHSPLVRCLVLTALVGGVSAVAFGLLRHRYHDDAVVMPWVEHMTIQFAGVFCLAIVVRYCANRLRPHLSSQPLVFSILQLEPYVMVFGWLLGTLLLLFVPAPAPDLGTDLSLYGFTYRSVVQLPALFYAILSCGVWLWLLRNFGPASTPNELVLKKRLLPISVAMFSWTLLWGSLWEDHGLVFPNRVGKPMDHNNLYRRDFKKMLKKAELPNTFRFYDLRHTCATLLLLKNVNPKVVQELLGHATITQTLDTYSHVLPTMQDAATDAMESALS